MLLREVEGLSSFLSMRVHVALVLASLVLPAASCSSPEASHTTASPEASGEVVRADTVRADWGVFFDKAGARGTFVMMETATGRVSRYNPERAARRVTPASTSKLFNSLVFLDQGVITDVDSMLTWDGVERRLETWNRDNSLRTGVQYSVVWLFQRLALEVGPEGFEHVFARQPYGNSTMGEPLEMAWLNGTLLISADEQLEFVRGLHDGTLNFSPEAQATVRSITPELASGVGWRLFAKTGWGFHEGQEDVGWLIGWVERTEGDVIFAMNAEQAGEGIEWDMAPGRLQLVLSILGAEGIAD